MRCYFQANQPVHIDGETVTGVFAAELTDYIEALVDHGLVEPVFAPPSTVDVPCWELDHCAA